jgi:hypothetical protein
MKISSSSATQQKQVLLECILKDPRHPWLKYMESPQNLRACVRLYLDKLSFSSQCRPRV